MDTDEKIQLFHMSHCGCCNMDLTNISPVEMCRIQFVARPDLDGKEGKFVHVVFKPSRLTIAALVPTLASEATSEGIDLIAACCSKKCSESIMSAAQGESEIREIFDNPESN